MDYVDASGCPRNYGECFIDASGCFRNWGDSFIDYDGMLRNFGEPFVDKSGFMRNFEEGFVDGDGIWREPRNSLWYLDRTKPEQSGNSNNEKPQTNIDNINVSSDVGVAGLIFLKKLFKYIFVFNGLNILFVIEPIVFLILSLRKKKKGSNSSNVLIFAVILSGFITIEWIVIFIYIIINKELYKIF